MVTKRAGARAENELAFDSERSDVELLDDVHVPLIDLDCVVL